MFLKISNILIFSISLFVLSSCSQFDSTSQPAVESTATTAVKENGWKQRKYFLSKKQSWNLNSKISLRFSDENWIFGLRWAQQAASRYAMNISNPLTGALVAKLNRNTHGVTLLANDGKMYKDSDEERLLHQQTNLNLPVKGLQYWVRGLTSPQNKVDKLVLDAQGRPQIIYQAGWKINYSKYVNNKFDAMPKKIVLTRNKDDLYLKVIAKKWQGT